jgi:hypothetical protein
MKKLRFYKYMLLGFVLSVILQNNRLAAQADSIPAKKIIKLHYFSSNNSLQYLTLESMLKKGKIFTPQPYKEYTLYLDSGISSNLVGKLQTNENGKAKAFIPPSLKAAWDASSRHIFILNEGDEEVISDFTISKAKIILDTTSTDGIKNITVWVMKMENDQWLPAKDVEMKIGIARQGGILSAGDAATYTTDSTGSVSVEYKRDKLPGDSNGNIILVAKVEDNDLFGNLMVERKSTWGVVTKQNNKFSEQRTLWSTRFRTPYWLLLMAYSIIAGVWGAIIYLVFQLIKIKKLGAA